ncbi:MAG: alpha/beta hydrolase [Parerythrobacter sp.]
MTDNGHHTMPDGRRIACRFTPGTMPAIVFLPGYMSDMEGGKASALFAQCKVDGRACLLLDYSGCGQSSGDFADGTLSRWRDEVLALIAAHELERVVLVGSSMGGWLMLLAGLALDGDRLAGLVGIAAAPDFTQWGRTDTERAALERGETVYEPSEYGDPLPHHPGFHADGEAHRLLDTDIALTCPVRLLHGQDDIAVPPALSTQLAAALRSDDIQVTLVKAGDHRLSRPSDIALLLRTVAGLADNTA